jgi:hypothetical protein
MFHFMDVLDWITTIVVWCAIIVAALFALFALVAFLQFAKRAISNAISGSDPPPNAHGSTPRMTPEQVRAADRRYRIIVLLGLLLLVGLAIVVSFQQHLH